MVPFLVVLSGLAWTVAYAECIRVGLRDRTYAMPLAALGLNIAWESTYAVHGLAGAGGAQPVINLVWALADLVIALPKWIGTLAPTIAIGVYEHSPFILGIGILCSVFDLAYIGLLRNAPAAERGPKAAAPAPAPAVRRNSRPKAGSLPQSE